MIMSFTANEYYNGGSGLGGLLDIPGWVIGPFVDGVPFFYLTDLIATDTLQMSIGRITSYNVCYTKLLR